MTRAMRFKRSKLKRRIKRLKTNLMVAHFETPAWELAYTELRELVGAFRLPPHPVSCEEQYQAQTALYEAANEVRKLFKDS